MALAYMPASVAGGWDVELGRQAAAEVEQQLPTLRDENVPSSVTSIGRRLVGVISPEFRHPVLGSQIMAPADTRG